MEAAEVIVTYEIVRMYVYIYVFIYSFTYLDSCL
jgi:hypothetical protein